MNETSDITMNIVFSSILFLFYISLTLCDKNIRDYLMRKEKGRFKYMKFGIIFIAYIGAILGEIFPIFRIYLTEAISFPLFIAYVYSKLSLQSRVVELESKNILSEFSYLKALKAQYEKELEEARNQIRDPDSSSTEIQAAREGLKIAKEKLKNINEIIAGYEIFAKKSEN